MTHRAFDGYVTTQTANGVDGYETIVRAQNATGTGSKGGNLILTSGKGASQDGYISFRSGSGAEIMRVTNTGFKDVTVDGYLHTTGNTTLDGYLHIVGDTTLDGYLRTKGPYNLFDGYIRTDGYLIVDGYTTIDGYTVTFDGYAQAPKISQSAAPMPGVDGYHLTIEAQDSITNPAHGGDLILRSGDGYNGDGYVRDGYIKLITGSRNVMTLDGYNVSFFLDLGSFGDGKNVIFLANAAVVPANNPVGGGILYVENGDLKYKGPSGTITTIATA